MQSYSFDISHISGIKMPADFLSRVVDRVDKDAPALEDDSALVFTVADFSSKPCIVSPKLVRPDLGRRRQTSIITFPACQTPHSQQDMRSIRYTDFTSDKHSPEFSTITPQSRKLIASKSVTSVSSGQVVCDFCHKTGGTTAVQDTRQRTRSLP